MSRFVEASVWNAGFKQGSEYGIEDGRLTMLFDLVNDSLLKVSSALAYTNMTEDEFREEMELYLHR